MMPSNALQPTAMSPLRGSTISLAALGAADRRRSATTLISSCDCRPV